MLATPFFGWAASMTFGAGTSFFGLFDLPLLPPQRAASFRGA